MHRKRLEGVCGILNDDAKKRGQSQNLWLILGRKLMFMGMNWYFWPTWPCFGSLSLQCNLQKIDNMQKIFRGTKLWEIAACFIYIYWKHLENALSLFIAANKWGYRSGCNLAMFELHTPLSYQGTISQVLSVRLEDATWLQNSIQILTYKLVDLNFLKIWARQGSKWRVNC